MIIMNIVWKFPYYDNIMQQNMNTFFSDLYYRVSVCAYYNADNDFGQIKNFIVNNLF